MEKIPVETESKTTSQIVYIERPVEKMQKKLFSEAIINKVLVALVVLLVFAVLATYFVEDLPSFVPEFRSIAIDAVWLIACCYAIGELVKRIAINKARTTTEFVEAKKKAKEELSSLTKEELDERHSYCEAYEERVYTAALDRLLKDAEITKDDYNDLYKALTVKEIKAKYPDCTLSKKQYAALKEINRLRRVKYNPEFLNTTIEVITHSSPSEMYNAGRENTKNMISSAVMSILSGVFCASFVGSLVFSFSVATLFAAVVKIVLTAFFAAIKAIFGWSLVMNTEINRYTLQTEEAKNLKNWCKTKNKKECATIGK